MAHLHALVAEQANEPADVVVGIETDRGMLVGALVAAATSSLPSTPWSWLATAIATWSREPSRIPETPRCWPIWSAPIATTTAPWPVT